MLKVALLAALMFGIVVPLAAVLVGRRPPWRRLLGRDRRARWAARHRDDRRRGPDRGGSGPDRR